jgi:hypothetical protein
MSLWDRIKERVKRIIGPAEHPTPPTPPPVEPERPSRGEIDRSVRPLNRDFDAVWDDMADTLERRLTDQGVEAFNSQQDRLMGLFDIISDPHQSDVIQADAYDELADELVDFGFTFRHGLDNIGDFDWVEFGAKYPKLGEK